MNIEKEYDKLIKFLLKYHAGILKEYEQKVNKGEPLFKCTKKVE